MRRHGRRGLILRVVLLGLGAVGPANAEGVALKQLDATRSRPLFSPTRRPPAPVAVLAAPSPPLAAIAGPPPAPPLQLTGVILGERSMAIVKRGNDPRPVSVEVGSTIEGWVVAAIRPRAIELKQASRSVTITLPRY